MINSIFYKLLTAGMTNEFLRHVLRVQIVLIQLIQLIGLIGLIQLIQLLFLKLNLKATSSELNLCEGIK